MKGFKGSLRVRIIVTVLLVTVLSNVFISFVVRNKSSASLEEMMYLDLQHNVSAVAKDMSLNNQVHLKLLETLSTNPQIKDPNVSLIEKTKLVQQAIPDDNSYVDISIIDMEGNSYKYKTWELMNLKDNDYFINALKGSFQITDPFRATEDMTLMVYSYPVYDNRGNIINVLYCVLDGYFLSDVCMQYSISQNRKPYVISAKTKITLANEDHWKVGVEDLAEIEKQNAGTTLGDHLTYMLSGETGHDIYTDNGQKWMGAWERVPDTNWIAACSVPFSDFEDKVRALTVSISIIYIILTLLSLIICGIVISASIKPLSLLKKAIVEIASGNADLTKRLKVASKDEVGDVVDGFNLFTGKLHSIISQVKGSKEELAESKEQMNDITHDTASAITEIIANIESVNNQIISQSASVEETAGAVNEIASNIESLEKMIENQSAGVVQASAAVEEMIGNINSVNTSVDKMAKSFDKLEENAKTGTSLQEDVNSKIDAIKDQSEMLQDANSVIANIAEQTNLLAMNAAIEAAHAGDAGKGFAVVADEIRKLSETSTEQSKTIGVQLGKIRESIESVVEASAESSSAFQEVVSNINDTNELVQLIKNAMEEQTIGSKQINEALHSMNDSTQEVKTASNEMSAGNQAILEEMHNLQNATMTMKDSVTEMGIGAKRINETGAALSSVASVMNDSIDKIGKEIDLFKV